MSELHVITETLERAARRRRWERAFRGLWFGLFVGGGVFLAANVVFKLFPIPVEIVWWCGGAALACVAGGFLIGGWRKPGLAETARWVDVQQHLKERMSTALEVANTEGAGTWRDLVLHDAISHVQEIDPRRLVPFSLTRAARWALLVLVLAAGLGFVPEYRSKKALQQQADAKVIKEAGKQIAELTRRELQQRPPALEATKKSLEAVTELGDQLKKASLTRSEALKGLANVSDKLKDQLKDLSKDPALKKMEQAARSPGTEAQTAAGIQKQMESLQKQMGNQKGTPEAMDKLQKDLEKLQEAAKALADKPGEGADADRQKLSASLAALSKQAADLGVQLPQLDDAIAALAANQTDRFLKDLDAAVNDLEKLSTLAKKLEQLQAQAEKLGKDLAEQLKNGQAEAAASTLKKLAEQLKSANLSSEQQRKILEEVSQALPHAGDYGKVADLLKQGTKQMEQGDKPAASQSLAAAAKELENLLQQMGDAESLMASLENLDKASMSIGTCQGWGMCQGKKPGFNPFGRNPGAGVGTWGAEGGEWAESGDWTPHADNSELNNRDMAGRGVTEREQRDVADALKPTKVKGKFAPGGQMPSITLKGVSIKGTSKVAYEEAATAAQSDAQSALSQEKVPRAHQGAVKDYFDDLKK